MSFRRSLLLPFAAAATLTACGGGGGGSPADVKPGPQEPATVSDAPDKFLLFPNPQQQPDGSLQTNTLAYADAYYRAVDPLNQRDTLAKWKSVNQWDTGTGSQYTVVFGDKRDLGYGRRMNVRVNPDGTLSFFVENYLVQAGPDYVYSPLNLDAAVVRDTKWLASVNAIEWSPGPDGGASFPKYYQFDPAGARRMTVDLDNRGDKAMPGPCITCHGGRGDALTPAGKDGKPLFNKVQNTASQTRGDVAAKLHPFEPDAFDFSTTRAGFSRVEQEAAIKAINKAILCSYPITGTSTAPEDACRRPAIAGEWLAPQAKLIKTAYGGDGMPAATFDDTFVPDSWLQAGQSTLYKEVIATSCRTCHSMRGSGAQSDLDFNDVNKFAEYAPRTKVHVFERGNMPLAKIVYDAFWNSDRPKLLADFLQAHGVSVKRGADGKPLKPGSPVAVVGPDRAVTPGATKLSGANSQYANGYTWTIVSGAGATLSEASTASPTFNATAAGTYVVQLVVTNGSTQSDAVRQTIVVAAGSPAPSALRFADIKNVMQEGNRCTQCHSPDGTLPHPPVWYANLDRNGDGTVGDATDDAWFYAEVRSRINFTDIEGSALLRKPSGNHHGGNLIPGFDTSKPPGDPARVRYDLFVNWISNGAPQ
jgi:mono/diheme cytochrome c family protein